MLAVRISNPLHQFFKQLIAVLVVSSQIIFDIKKQKWQIVSAYGPKLDLREATGKMGLHLGVDEANQCFQTSIKKMICKWWGIFFKKEFAKSMISRNFRHENYITFLIEVPITLTL